MQTNIIYSKRFPRACTPLLNLFVKSCTVARTTSNGILSQHLINFLFKASIFSLVSIVLFINIRLIFNVFPSLNISGGCPRQNVW